MHDAIIKAARMHVVVAALCGVVFFMSLPVLCPFQVAVQRLCLFISSDGFSCDFDACDKGESDEGEDDYACDMEVG